MPVFSYLHQLFKGVALLLQHLKPWFSSLLFCPVLSSVFSSSDELQWWRNFGHL